MATTLQTRIADLIGTPSDLDAVKDALTTGAKVLIDLMPEDVLEENSVDETVDSNGLALGEYRIHSAHKSGYGARRVPSSMRALVQDSGSVHYAVPTDPVMVIYDDKVYIYPSGGTIMKVDYPTISTVTATSISGIQTKLEQIVVLYAAIQLLLHQIHTAHTAIGTLESSIPSAPSAISAPSFTYTTVNGQTVDITPPSISVSGSLPTFTKPTFQGSFTSVTTPLDTNEDIDLAMGHLARVKDYLTQYKLDLDNEIAEFNKEVEVYRRAFDAAVKFAEMDLETRIHDAVKTAEHAMTAALANQKTELEEQVAEYQATLQKYGAEVESYVGQINGWAIQVKAKLDTNAGRLTLMEQLQQQYKLLLQVHLGVE